MLKRLAVLVAWGFVAANAQVPRDRSKPNDKSHTGKQQPQSVEPFGLNLQVEMSPPKQEKQENAKPYQWRELYAPANVPNWVLAIVALWAGIMALKTLRAIKQQADLMKAQADHMGEQTAILQDSVAAAKKSADAAESSAIAAMGVAVPALLLEEFAFIPMVGVALETSLQFPRMAISVRNYGQSPAILRSFAVEFSCGNPPLDFRCKDILCFDSGTAVESGKVKDLEEGGVTSSKAFSTEDVSDIMNGKKFLTVYGSVWYDDVFGSPTHELRFCKWAVSAWPDDQQLRWIDCDLLARYEAENQKAK